MSAGHASGDTNAPIDLKMQPRGGKEGEGRGRYITVASVLYASDMRNNKTSASFRSRNATRRTNDANES